MPDLLDPAARAADSWAWALVVLLAAVLLGALLPVVPTGAAVSAMAALAHHRSWASTGEVLLVGAAAAHAGDLVLYALLHRSENRLARLLHRRSTSGRAAAHVAELGERLARHDVRTLVAARLLPGARVPVMVAAAGTAYPVRRFAVAAAVPALAWSLVYSAIGLAGRSASDRPLVGAAVAVALGVGVTVLVGLVQRRRAARRPR
ncbi:DedA family protein [Kineococcus indalonis]|uniref:DedA family protein n=1 Tax=Kineococcus indalonis TaxID=2696566 RepID=UPI001412723F|nr:VTT domain-containing protein [Kineococcus indalonis]NAZ85042.1 hypothetical protein [Kineococcus indalonis]